MVVYINQYKSEKLGSQLEEKVTSLAWSVKSMAGSSLMFIDLSFKS